MLKFKTYLAITKPGIIRGNALTATGGFLLAAKGDVDFWLFISMLLGLSLIIASACVFNNYIDRGIDRKMSRTKNRALVTGEISSEEAIIYASFLGILGMMLLVLNTPVLTLVVALFGFFAYVVLYGIGKRRTVHGTLIGSLSGAVPPVVGYVAVTSHLDSGAFILFLILICWQMPHFYAIAIYRLKDYAAANIPVLPREKGISNTKIQIFIYIIAFMAANTMLTLYGHTGYVYMITMFLLSFAWLILGIHNIRNNLDEKLWGRKMFLFSLIVILAFSLLLSIETWIP